MNEQAKERFFNYVEYIPESSCHWWIAGLDKDGYGKFKLAGQDHRAHRISYNLAFGKIKNGLMVLHRCDNPSCVNPDHLFLGTAADNARDRDSKNRGGSAPGIKNAMAKLDDEKVREIRKDRRDGKSLEEICARHNVSAGTASRIYNNLSWTHVKG